nr:hypothetical protein BaRGS_034564 [Batillaria attramentaria]
MKGKRRNIPGPEDKSVGGDKNRAEDDTAENKQNGSQSLSAEAKDSVIREKRHTKQYNATLKRFDTLNKNESAKERAFVRSLLVVFLLMVLCSLPYGIILIIRLINPSYVITKTSIFIVVMVYFNCSVNWIVYGVMNRSFRQRYVALPSMVFSEF